MERRDARSDINIFIPEPNDAEGCEYYLSTGNKLLDKVCYGYPKVIKKDTSGIESVFWDSGSIRFKLDQFFEFFIAAIVLTVAMKIKGKNKRKKEEEEKRKLFDKFKNLKIDI